MTERSTLRDGLFIGAICAGLAGAIFIPPMFEDDPPPERVVVEICGTYGCLTRTEP